MLFTFKWCVHRFVQLFLQNKKEMVLHFHFNVRLFVWIWRSDITWLYLAQKVMECHLLSVDKFIKWILQWKLSGFNARLWLLALTIFSLLFSFNCCQSWLLQVRINFYGTHNSEYRIYWMNYYYLFSIGKNFKLLVEWLDFGHRKIFCLKCHTLNLIIVGNSLLHICNMKSNSKIKNWLSHRQQTSVRTQRPTMENCSSQRTVAPN